MTRAPRLTRRTLLAGTAAAAAAPLLGCGEPVPAVQGGFLGIAHERGHLLRAPRAAAATPAVTRRAQVVIAGGGVAGLAAARALRLAGVDDMALLELEDMPGGNSRAAVVGGLPCPMGAHYLPVPGDDAHEVQDLLEEFGVRQRVAGRWQYDERYLCHSPQERLYIDGAWHEGLLPMHAASAGTLAQYRRFAEAIAAERQSSQHTMPSFRAPFDAHQRQLAAQGFAPWLDALGLTDPHLRWYLDYCCRDDYGAGVDAVSAWAGVHYFASRHGFSAPGATDDTGDRGDGVLTWPEGNGWLSQRLAAPLGLRAQLARTVLRIAPGRHGVTIDAFDHRAQQVERWEAAQCIVALPLHVAARVVEPAPAFLAPAAARTPHAAWVVANLHLAEPLLDRPGAAPAWDNVLYGSKALGYVDARHQSLDPRPGPTVLTWYRALGPSVQARRALLDQPWSAWRDEVLGELAGPHPDLPRKTRRLEVTRYGHAMAVPAPQADPVRAPPVPTAGRLLFAHSDWAGYSVFEEAFTRGHLAGEQAARTVRGARR